MKAYNLSKREINELLCSTYQRYLLNWWQTGTGRGRLVVPADGGHVAGLALHGQVVIALGGRRRWGAALGRHRRPAPAQRSQVFRLHGLVVPVGGNQLDAIANGVLVTVTGASHVGQPLDL